jgi:abequosyltransferase
MDTHSQQVFLSFCIPTFNQPESVKKTLNSFLSQEVEGVEIIIRDDSDNFETEKIINDYLTKLPIRYFHMQKDGGIDGAFLFLSREAKGQYIWWFGDDTLVPGVIERLLGILRLKPAIDFIYLNSTDFDGVSFSIPPNGNKYFFDRNEVLEELKDQLGFCSAMVFRKDVLSLGFDKCEVYFGTCWVTLFLVLNVLVEGKTFFFLDGPNFLSEPKLLGEARWYDPFLVHGINFALIVNQFKGKFKHSSVRKVLAEKFSKSWRAVVVERALGFNSGFAKSDFSLKVLFKLYWSYPEFYIGVPIMFLPQGMLFRLYRLYNLYKKC